MKINEFSSGVFKWYIVATSIIGMSLAACSKDEQELVDPVEESSEVDGESAVEDVMDEYSEEQNADGYESEEGSVGSYGENVSQAAEEMISDTNIESNEDAESSANGLEGMIKDGPVVNAPSESEYEGGYEETELTGSENVGEQVIDHARSRAPDGSLESLKSSPYGDVTKSAKASPVTSGEASAENVNGNYNMVSIPAGTQAVMYVKAEKANLRQGPGTNHSVVGSLVKGERIVGTIDGSWARTSKGTYISASLLTLSPVGRARLANDWSSKSN